MCCNRDEKRKNVLIGRNVELKTVWVWRSSIRAIPICGELEDGRHSLVGCSEIKIWRLNLECKERLNMYEEHTLFFAVIDVF
jgi:hypothetical protein